ncbi:MAG: hypothetical protein ACFFDN_12405 [Candidatus Hodarchaeota archaeon]
MTRCPLYCFSSLVKIIWKGESVPLFYHFNFRRLRSLVILFLLLSASILYASNNREEVKNILIGRLELLGFENVSVRIEQSNLVLTYENRVFRDEIKALKKVLFLLNDVLKRENDLIIKNVDLIPQNRRVPLIVISTETDILKKFFDKMINSEIFAESINLSFDIDEKFENFPVENKSKNKIDVVFTPKFETELDAYGDPIKLRLGIAPGIETILGRGSYFRGEYIIPLVHRQFEVGDSIDGFRPGFINMNQVFRLPGTAFVSTSFGVFSNNRYGIDLEFRKYWFNGLLNTGLNIGYTGSMIVYNRQWDISVMKDFTWFIDTGVRLPAYNMTFALNYGQYINKDKGFRADIYREFNEVDIGFYINYTKSNLLGDFTSAGFNFSIPIFPDKYSLPRLVRIRPDKYFRWEYNAKHFVFFHQKKYETGNSIRDFIKRLQPDYIRAQIRKFSPDDI